MKRKIFGAATLLLIIAVVLVFALRDRGSPPSTAQIISGRLMELTVHAPSLEKNLLNDSVDRTVIVYLPPGYDEESKDKRYPVLYLLHGYASSLRDWTSGAYQGMNIQVTMDSLIQQNKIQPLLIVMPDADNAYWGGFYMNSATTGNWEDFIIRDLVQHIDTNYRTLAHASSRGIAGHSMGGFGALVLAMKHPEIFGATYALSPCCLAMEADISQANEAWSRVLRLQTLDELRQAMRNQDFYVPAIIALASAFSPNPNKPPFYVDSPFQLVNGQIKPNETVLATWQEKFPINLVQANKANLLKLAGIFLDYGIEDEFIHIPIATPNFSRTLAEHRIPHSFEVYSGDHRNRIRERMETRVLPFFAKTLDFSQPH
jgi:S-formylglutathione hydrolase FrmB